MSSEKEKLETFCIACGDPIPRKDMGLTVRDNSAVKWDDKGFADVKLHFCRKCWLEREAWLAAGIRGAVSRQEAKLKQGPGNFT